jgi:hypothetical protein
LFDSGSVPLIKRGYPALVAASLHFQEPPASSNIFSFASSHHRAKLCELGVTGLTIPEEYNGLGIDIVAAVAAIEELVKRGSSLCGPFIKDAKKQYCQQGRASGKISASNLQSTYIGQI